MCGPVYSFRSPAWFCSHLKGWPTCGHWGSSVGNLLRVTEPKGSKCTAQDQRAGWEWPKGNIVGILHTSLCHPPRSSKIFWMWTGGSASCSHPFSTSADMADTAYNTANSPGRRKAQQWQLLTGSSSFHLVIPRAIFAHLLLVKGNHMAMPSYKDCINTSYNPTPPWSQRVGNVWWMALRTDTWTSGISLNLLVLQRELELVHLPLNFGKEWQVNIHMMGHFDGPGIREHVLGHDLWGGGPALSNKSSLWQAESREPLKGFWPKALKTMSTVTAWQKSCSFCFLSERKIHTHTHTISLAFHCSSSSHPQNEFQHAVYTGT